MRKTSKSKLVECIIPDNNVQNEEIIDKHMSAYVLDMMAQIRSCINNVPETFEQFIEIFLSSIPKNFRRVDLVADTYRDISIKSEERENRNSSSKIIIGSIKSKIPKDVEKFLSNNENKTQLIQLIFRYIQQNFSAVLVKLATEMIFLSRDNECFRITSRSYVTNRSFDSYPALVSSQEEADTKVILHSMNLSKKSELGVVLRSLSGDTDITVLAVALIDDRNRVLYDHENGDNRKTFWLNSINISDKHRSAIIGFHAFTGNDHVSSFFRKGKKRCCEVAIKNSLFLAAFAKPWDHWNLEEQVILTLEEYICCIFGCINLLILFEQICL